MAPWQNRPAVEPVELEQVGLRPVSLEPRLENVPLPVELCRELDRLSLLHDRSVSDLIRHAVEIHYSDAAVSARHRLVDRLARLESELGDPESLQDQIAAESRTIRAR